MAEWTKRLQEVFEERTGTSLVSQDHLAMLEASDTERRALQKELDLLGWYVLDYVGGQPGELRATERRKMAAQARMVWIQDPVAGASVDLTNEFVFGRGVPKPKAADKKVQEVIDEAWDDADNKLVLTTFPAQCALCTDLMLQSNLFILFFEGDDGKVKLGLLDHDAVEDAVRDSQNRLRILYYVARKRTYGWDYNMDRPNVKAAMSAQDPGKPRVYYYQALAATDSDTGMIETNDPTPPPNKLGTGLVYHIAINKGAEQVFGTPAFRRVVKWMAALNDFMAARVDLTQAAAAFIMKRSIKGTPNQVAKIAAQAVSRRSDLAAVSIDDPNAGTILPGPRPGSILNDSDAVTTTPFSVSTQASQAQQDAQMIRSQIAAATGWPQHYLGDQSNANLATASALELPVIKRVEAIQELFEGLFRTFIDRAIQKAVDDGVLPTELTAEERAALKKKNPAEEQDPTDADTGGQLGEAYEGQTADEEATERDLSYEFSMPNPLKRAMADLINAVANIARTFDPNNTNLELSRVLLSVAFSQGLDLPDAASAVERILPEGYIDPMIALQAAMGGGGGGGGGQPPPGGAPGLVPPAPNFYGPSANMGPDGQQNPYSAPGQSSDYMANQGQLNEAALGGRRPRTRGEALDELWAEEMAEIQRGLLASSNGKH